MKIGLGKETFLPNAKCWWCGEVLPVAQDAEGGDATPVDGDVTICAACMTVNVFNADLSLRAPTQVELDEIEACELVQTMRRALLRAHDEINDGNPLDRTH